VWLSNLFNHLLALALAAAGAAMKAGRRPPGSLDAAAVHLVLVLLDQLLRVVRQVLELLEPQLGGFLAEVPVPLRVLQRRVDPAHGPLQRPKILQALARGHRRQQGGEIV